MHMLRPREDDSPDLPLWTVGTPHRADDWIEVRAADAKGALDAWVQQVHGKDWCAECPRRTEADEVCKCYPGIGVTRQE